MTDQERYELMYDEIVDLKNTLKHRDSIIESLEAKVDQLNTENTNLIDEYTEIQNIAIEHFARKLKERSYTLEDCGVEVIDVEDVDNLRKDIYGTESE